MTVCKDEYVVVNMWTSKGNKALTGVNLGHTSLTIMDGFRETYISFWLGDRKPYKAEFFQEGQVGIRRNILNFLQRPQSYKQDYEQDCILEAIQEDNYREINDISECLPDETVYQLDTNTFTFIRVIDHQPKGFESEERLWAIKLVPADFRMVLHSIDVGKILVEFNRLRNPEYITGWSLVGSNLLTRNANFSGKITENCSSLIYRCLDKGGLNSSRFSQDDLIMDMRAAKINEVCLYHGNLDDWKVEGVDESSLDMMIEVNNQVGKNINRENDIPQDLQSSVVGCTLF